jgi:hypothetical protein
VWCSVAVIVSDKPDASIFSATYSLVDEGCRYPCNVWNYIPAYTASCHAHRLSVSEDKCADANMLACSARTEPV